MKHVVHRAPPGGVPGDFAYRASGGNTYILKLTKTHRATGSSICKDHERRATS
jgi:hypothetical protein